MSLPKRQLISVFNKWLHWLLLFCVFAFPSCYYQKQKPIKNQAVKKPTVINQNKKTHFTPPEIVFITSANKPTIVKAGKPTIIIDSLNIGAPFFSSYTTDQSLPINFVDYCMQDKEGNIWIGTGGSGLVKYNGKSFITYTTAQGLPDNFIETIMQDKAGNIWLGTLSNGVSMYNGEIFTNYSAAEGLAGNLVASMVQDDNGNMWFATDKGASMYDGKTFTNFTIAQGLPDALKFL